MIEPEDVAKLAGCDPEEKFWKLERLARQKLSIQRSAFDATSPIYNDRDYMIAILAVADECGIEQLAKWKLPPRSADDDTCLNFRDEASRVSQQLLLRHGIKNASVALDAATKEIISHHLRQMRGAVEAADVSDKKKDRIFALINQLQAEVDRERTPVHAIGELFVTVCAYAAEGTKKLDPVFEGIRRVSASLGIAKNSEDSRPRLRSSPEPKRIEYWAPDDEIPF